MRTSLIEDALAMAFTQRRPAPGLIFHSDRDCQLGLKGSSQHALLEGVSERV